MSKNKIVENRPANELKTRIFGNYDYLQDNTPLFTRGWQMKNLEGRILTLIESAGLANKQEEALKSYARREIWDTIREMWILSSECEDFIFPIQCSPSDTVKSTK